MAADLGPFEVGQILALHREGYSHRQIAERVTRGRDHAGPSPSAVGETVCRLETRHGLVEEIMAADLGPFEVAD